MLIHLTCFLFCVCRQKRNGVVRLFSNWEGSTFFLYHFWRLAHMLCSGNLLHIAPCISVLAYRLLIYLAAFTAATRLLIHHAAFASDTSFSPLLLQPCNLCCRILGITLLAQSTFSWQTPMQIAHCLWNTSTLPQHNTLQICIAVASHTSTFSFEHQMGFTNAMCE